MSEDRSAALLDTDEQTAVLIKHALVARRGRQRWACFGLRALCLAVLICLILIYALVSLPEWLSLLTGMTIVLVGAALIAGIGTMTRTPLDWNDE